MEFTGELGHTYHFRSSGTDNALNVESWSPDDGDAGTTFFLWRTIGTVQDNTNVPISAADISVDPPAFLTYPSDVDGFYFAYLAENPDVKSVTLYKGDYGALPVTEYGLPDAHANVLLPPSDNVIQDWGFESGILPGAWQIGGSISPTLDDTRNHNGSYAASLGVSTGFSEPNIIYNPVEYEAVSNPFAFDAQGGAHMAWSVNENGYKVYYSHRLPDYTWPPAELVTEQQVAISVVRLIVDTDQKVHLVYWVHNGGVFYTMRDINGVWSSPEVIVPNGSVEDIFSDDATNIYMLTKTETSMTFSHFSLGEGWETEPVPRISGRAFGKIIVDSMGRVHLVWSYEYFYHDQQVNYMQRPLGGGWSEPEKISEATYLYYLKIMKDSNEKLHVAWSSGYDVTNLFYAYMLPDGSWSPPVNPFKSLDILNFIAVMDSQDTINFLITDSGTYDPSGIFFAQKYGDGFWSSPQELSQPSVLAGYVDAASLGGDVFITWWEFTNGNPDIYYSRLRAGVWSTPLLFVNTPTDSINPHIAVDQMGGVYIAWTESNGLYPVAIYHVESTPLELNGNTRLSQALTVPISMTNPTLSVMAALSGVSSISGNEFQVLLSTAGVTTTLFTSSTPTSWDHFWFDLAPWSGEDITLTFQLTEVAGYPPAQVLLDEVTLGAGHPDVWIDLTGGKPIIRPGEQLTYQVDYGNRSGVTADSAVITLTLPLGLNFVEASLPPVIIGSQLTWQVGDLPAGAHPVPISVTLEVALSGPMFQTLLTHVQVTTSSIEIERLNNVDQSETYIAYRSYLSMIPR